MRVFLAVLIGYAIFTASAVLLFQFTQQDPHATPSSAFATASVIWGMIFAALGGFTAVRIARSTGILPSVLVGTVIAALALAAIAVEAKIGSIWPELATLLLVAPSAAAGGLIRRRKQP
jgi:hypothetical protein